MGLREEGLRVFGSWEPLAHHLQGGGASRGAEAAYAWVHTEEFIKGLRDRGLNLYITHFSKGYGIEAEADDREDTRRVADLCHKHGLYVGGYMRYSTFIPNTLRQEVPDCVERFGGVTAQGTHPRYGTHQYWRYTPCPTSTAWLEYLDRLIEIGVNDIGLDCLHVDGLGLELAPDHCHCPRCRDGFRQWLRGRYPSAQAQKERLGFAGVDCVDPPEYTMSPHRLMLSPILGDPLGQQWAFYRCHLLGRIWAFLVDAVHKRNPQCLIQGNAHLYPYANNVWFQGMMIAELERAGGDGLFSEESDAPNLTDDGRVHGYFETFKKLRQRGLRIFAYCREPVTHAPCTEPERLKRAMAHHMAFNLDSAGVLVDPMVPGMWPATVPEYMAFHRDRRDLFADVRQAHDVAIYYSEQTKALNSGVPVATQTMVRDVLMRGHVPFGYLLGHRHQDMVNYRAIVLPQVECLSDAEIATIVAYVQNGGGLVVIGSATGRFNPVRRLRTTATDRLCDALGPEWTDDTPAFCVHVGAGRVAFMPELMTPEGTAADLVDAAVTNADFCFYLDPSGWRPALNGGDVLRRLRWAADGFRFVPVVPDTVVVEYVFQEPHARHLLHFVNFDLAHDVGAFQILCRDAVPSRVAAFTPDGDPPAVAVRASDPAPRWVSVGGFHRYLIVEIA